MKTKEQIEMRVRELELDIKKKSTPDNVKIMCMDKVASLLWVLTDD